MALNMEKIAERLAKLNNKGGSNDISYITIKDGRNVVRILPPKNDEDFFAQEVFVHYGVGATGKDKGTTVVCPSTHGNNCPICEVVKNLRKKSSDPNDQYAKLASRMGRKTRVYFNAIDRNVDLSEFEYKDGKWTKGGKVESPVQILATGIGVYKDILSIITDVEYGDITDKDNGLDVIITKSGTGFNTNYDVKTVRKESAIGLDNWELGLHDLSIFAKTKSYDEIATLMNGGESSDEDEDTNKPAPNNNSNSVSEDIDEDSSVADDVLSALARRRG